GGIGAALRRDDGEQAITAGIYGNDVDGPYIACCVGVGQYINRIAATTVGREKIVQSMIRVGGEDGEFAAGGHQGISGKNARASGIGDDAQVRSARPGLLA